MKTFNVISNNVYFKSQPNMLLEKKTGKLLTTDEVDKKIQQQRTRNSLIVGAILGIVGTEMTQWKKELPLAKKMTNRALGTFIGAAFFYLLALHGNHFENTQKKLGLTTPQDKIFQYINRGYEPMFNVENKQSKMNLIDGIMVAIGATLGIIKGIKKDKIFLPAIEAAYAESKTIGAIVNGFWNALIYGIVSNAGQTLFNNYKNKQQAKTQ